MRRNRRNIGHALGTYDVKDTFVDGDSASPQDIVVAGVAISGACEVASDGACTLVLPAIAAASVGAAACTQLCEPVGRAIVNGIHDGWTFFAKGKETCKRGSSGELKGTDASRRQNNMASRGGKCRRTQQQGT